MNAHERRKARRSRRDGRMQEPPRQSPKYHLDPISPVDWPDPPSPRILRSVPTAAEACVDENGFDPVAIVARAHGVPPPPMHLLAEDPEDWWIARMSDVMALALVLAFFGVLVWAAQWAGAWGRIT